MKYFFFIKSVFLVLIASSCEAPPVNYETDLYKSKGLFYELKHNKPYTGITFSNYAGGNKKSTGNLMEGKKNGQWIYWFENGNIKSEENFLNGKPDGEHLLWYENNKLKLKCSFKNGIFSWFSLKA